MFLVSTFSQLNEARDSIKDMKGFLMILHFDGKIIQEFRQNSNKCRVGKNALLGIPP